MRVISNYTRIDGEWHWNRSKLLIKSGGWGESRTKGRLSEGKDGKGVGEEWLTRIQWDSAFQVKINSSEWDELIRPGSLTPRFSIRTCPLGRGRGRHSGGCWRGCWVHRSACSGDASWQIICELFLRVEVVNGANSDTTLEKLSWSTEVGWRVFVQRVTDPNWSARTFYDGSVQWVSY